MDNCIFCKIVKGDIPSAKVYEDEDMIIIKDLNPQAPVHLLLIPKEHYANIVEMSDKQAQTLAKCLKSSLRSPISSDFKTVSVSYPTRVRTVASRLGICIFIFLVVVNLAIRCAKTATNRA